MKNWKLPLAIMGLLLASCSGNMVNTGIEQQSPTNSTVRATDSNGAALHDDAVSVVPTAGGLELYANSPEVAGVTIELAADQHVVGIEQGRYFGPDDLFMVVSDVAGVVAIGGYHLQERNNPLLYAPAGKPVLLARIEFAAVSGGRIASKVPEGTNGIAGNYSYIDNGDGSVTFSWDYFNKGDYNQDGEVGIVDITPIGVNFGKKTGDDDWLTAKVADGDDNGEVNASDLTPIGQFFQTIISGYKLEVSDTVDGPWVELADISHGDGSLDPLLQFSYPLASPQDGAWFRIRSYSSEDESRGAATGPLQVNLLPPGDNPVAVAGANETSGEAPLTVTFFDDGSYDDDGTIEQWWWDLDGDGSFEHDATAQSGGVIHEYVNTGTYQATMKVIDDDGRWGTDTLVINVGQGGGTTAPDAYAFVMPNQGWGPLTVYLSPFGSEDPDGTIDSYKWDLDGDGTYETDATGTDGYTSTTLSQPGDHTIRLELTDDGNNRASASVKVTVWDKSASSVDYDDIFDDSVVRRVDFEVSQANWDAMWSDPDAELEVAADATVFGDLLADIGLRMKGNSSLNGPGQKKPWKVDTNESVSGQEFRNLKMLIFNNGFKDPSMSREILAYQAMEFAGVPASHCCYAEMWITIGTAQPEYWGVYTMVERVDKKYLENRFIDDTGNLYKAYMGADLTWKGADINGYPKNEDGDPVYAKKTNSAEADYSDIIELIDIVDNRSFGGDTEFMAAVEGVFNVDVFLRYQAVNKAYSNADSYSYMSQNYYLYNNPVSGVFEWIPWDMNEAWGQFGDSNANLNHPLYDLAKIQQGPGPGREAPLFTNVFAIPEYRQTYAAYVDLFRRNYFNRDDMANASKAYRDLIDSYVTQATGDKMEYSYSDFARNWDEEIAGGPGVFHAFGIGQFTEARTTYIDSHLLADL